MQVRRFLYVRVLPKKFPPRCTPRLQQHSGKSLRLLSAFGLSLPKGLPGKKASLVRCVVDPPTPVSIVLFKDCL